jgi:replicative DNA helicase
MKDWGSKLPGGVVRIAGLLHVAEHFDDWVYQSVSVTTMKAAIALGHYFTSHLLSVSDLMRADREADEAEKIWKWIANGQLESFTKRDAHHALLHVFPRADDLDLPLARLEERFHIHRVDVPHEGRGRPPSPRFETNPKCFKVPTELTEMASSPPNVLTELTELRVVAIAQHDPSGEEGGSHDPPVEDSYIFDDEALP